MLRDAFFPHAGNNYHPHALHGRRAAFYAAAFVAVKAIIVVSIFAIPSSLLMSEAAFAELEADLFQETNAVRAQYTQHELQPNAHLEESAATRALDLGTVGYFSHVSPDGRTFESFLKSSGYRYAVAGENLAMGFTDMRDVIAHWMKSTTHRQNIIASDYDDTGIGIARGIYDGRPVLFIAQHYGKQEREAPRVAAASFVDDTQSFVSWKQAGDDTEFSVTVATTEPVELLEAEVYGTTIQLAEGEDGFFRGSAVVKEHAEELFSIAMLPSVRATIGDSTQTESLRFDRLMVPGADIVILYEQGKAYLRSAPEQVYRAAQGLFLLGLIIAIAMLAIGLRTELRRRHPHLIGRAVALVVLLAVLFFV
ncbi:MAG: CAP domain-containing protein [Candidatus Uhrbacteria bacterium]